MGTQSGHNAGRDLVAWNAIITGYPQNGVARRALKLVLSMQEEAQQTDSTMIDTVSPSCADIESGFRLLVNVSTAIFGVYSKCGLVGTARADLCDVELGADY
ncbi:hypothetical protein HHK36_010910 [Tetracentron sinense]|uniref:Pentatricopeptide repeat-containing protein n=1 Tax=Tetracentron sinense TaxID=13715 RepID=A0A834Z763_TETSI|nr:hypothetical protein HHK36_010910 [Tetracentron sinense]